MVDETLIARAQLPPQFAGRAGARTGHGHAMHGLVADRPWAVEAVTGSAAFAIRN